MYRSMFCSAVMGVPQAMDPTRGTRAIRGMASNPSGITPPPFSSPSSQAVEVSRAAAKSSSLFWGMSLIPFSILVMEDLDR